MNYIKLLSVSVALLGVPAAALADEFDITMDVVGAEESFDEVIVNRIALPFDQPGSDRMTAPFPTDDVIDSMGSAVDASLSAAELGSGVAVERLGDSNVLPEVQLPITLP